MKTKNIFSGYFFAFAVMIVGLLSVTSCKKDKSDDNNNTNTRTYTVSGNATGAQENPAVTTSATAALSGTYNAGTNKLDYTISWTGLSGNASLVQFYGPAGTGVNGSLLLDLGITTNGVNGTSTGSITLADSTESHLLNGNVYYNIITVANPTGEIRGQVLATAN